MVLDDHLWTRNAIYIQIEIAVISLFIFLGSRLWQRSFLIVTKYHFSLQIALKVNASHNTQLKIQGNAVEIGKEIIRWISGIVRRRIYKIPLRKVIAHKRSLFFVSSDVIIWPKERK